MNINKYWNQNDRYKVKFMKIIELRIIIKDFKIKLKINYYQVYKQF